VSSTRSVDEDLSITRNRDFFIFDIKLRSGGVNNADHLGVRNAVLTSVRSRPCADDGVRLRAVTGLCRLSKDYCYRFVAVVSSRYISRSRDFFVALVSCILRQVSQNRSHSIDQVDVLFVNSNITTGISSGPDSLQHTRTSTRELNLFESDGYLRAVVRSSHLRRIRHIGTISSHVLRSIHEYRSNVVVVGNGLLTYAAVTTFVSNKVSADDDT